MCRVVLWFIEIGARRHPSAIANRVIARILDSVNSNTHDGPQHLPPARVHPNMVAFGAPAKRRKAGPTKVSPHPLTQHPLTQLPKPMPCRGDWSFEVRINGKAIKEHSIDGRKVITAAPGEEFEVAVDYSSFDGLFLVECYIDGQRTGRYFLDPARQTSRGGARGVVFKYWTKSQDGHMVNRRFKFAGASAVNDDDDEGGSSRPVVTSWEHGKIEIKIIQGMAAVLGQDTTSTSDRADPRMGLRVDEKCAAASSYLRCPCITVPSLCRGSPRWSHAADYTRHATTRDHTHGTTCDLSPPPRRGCALRTMVKSGLSVSVGAGATSFSSETTWRAGESYVTEAPGAPIVSSLECFFRDSFFMALREDTCCNGECAATPAAASTLREKAETLAASGNGGGQQVHALRASVVRERETREALARKRPKAEAPIDLCDSDDE